MSRTEQMTAEDIALVRRANANRASGQQKPASAASKSPSKKDPREAKQPESSDPDDRLRQVVAVLLALGAILTLLALVSYSRFDQANTDIVAQLLIEAADTTGSSLLVATHDDRIKAHFARTLELGMGAIVQ